MVIIYADSGGQIHVFAKPQLTSRIPAITKQAVDDKSILVVDDLARLQTYIAPWLMSPVRSVARRLEYNMVRDIAITQRLPAEQAGKAAA